VKSGSMYSLLCEAQAFPVPIFRWACYVVATPHCLTFEVFASVNIHTAIFCVTMLCSWARVLTLMLLLFVKCLVWIAARTPAILTYIFLTFPQPFLANAGRVAQIRPWLCLTKSFPIHYSCYNVVCMYVCMYVCMCKGWA
jgi:hypothetical protein